MDDITKIIKGKVKYDSMGTMIIDQQNNHILDVRGWGRFQHMAYGEKIQDSVGEFIANAINEKIETMSNRKAPWPDFEGNVLYEGDTIKHPASGQTGIIIYFPHRKEPTDQWCVDYGDDIESRLCLQIDIGMATKHNG